MGTFSAWHWLIVLAVILLLFGAKRIPELAKGLGSGIKNFKNAIKEEEVPAGTPAAEVKAEATATPVQPTATTTHAAPAAGTTTTAASTSTQDAPKA